MKGWIALAFLLMVSEVSAQTPLLERHHIPPHAPVPLSEIWASSVEQKAIKPGAVLEPVEELVAARTLERESIIEVHSLPDERGYFYLAGKGEPSQWRVHMRHVSDITAVTQMYRPPRFYQEISQHKNVPPLDRSLHWFPEITLAAGQINAPWLADFSDTNEQKTINKRIGASFLTRRGTTAQIGATVQYETAQFTQGSADANYRNLTYGMVVKSPLVEGKISNWRLGAQARYGPSSRLYLRNNGGTQDFQLRTTAMQIMWEDFHANEWGEWSWGITWQREWVKFHSLDPAYQSNFRNQRNFSTTIGFFISQGFH